LGLPDTEEGLAVENLDQLGLDRASLRGTILEQLGPDAA
jgi:hypothetical protein